MEIVRVYYGILCITGWGMCLSPVTARQIIIGLSLTSMTHCFISTSLALVEEEEVSP